MHSNKTLFCHNFYWEHKSERAQVFPIYDERYRYRAYSGSKTITGQWLFAQITDDSGPDLGDATTLTLGMIVQLDAFVVLNKLSTIVIHSEDFAMDGMKVKDSSIEFETTLFRDGTSSSAHFQ